MLNYKTGHFLIQKETSKDTGTVLANLADKQAIFNFWDQLPYQNVTASLRRKTVLENGEDGMYTPFSDFLKQNNRRITVNENKIRYSKTAKGRVTWRVGKTLTGQNGLRRENFNLQLNTSVLKPGDKVGPEEGFQFVLIVQSLPRPVGDLFEYTVRHGDADKHSFFPEAYLREGTRFVKRGSSNYSEASLDWGSTLWDKGHSVLTWEVGLFKTGKELKITDEALQHVFTLTPCDAKGNVVPDMPKTFLTEAELNMSMEVEKEMEEDLLFGQYNYTVADTSTRLVRQIGAGWFDFAKDGHIFDYSPANSSIREFTDFTESIWYNNLGQITFGTGRPGLQQASDWINAEFGELTVIRDYEHYIERTGNIIPGGAEAWKLKKPMFNTYELPVGGVVTFELWPWLDDRSRRGTKHPTTGKPLLGYHYFATRFAGQGENSNVVLVNKANAEQWGYDPGATGLYGVGGGGKNLHTHSGRYATLRHGNSYGMFLEDINDLVWFRPNVV